MKIVKGESIWDSKGEAILIPSSASVSKRQLAVVEYGLGEEIENRFPSFPYMLGLRLRTMGNHVHIVLSHNSTGSYGFNLMLNFPVKRFRKEGLHEKVIARSCMELTALKAVYRWKSVFFPQVFEEEEWGKVKYIFEEVFKKDDGFIVVDELDQSTKNLTFRQIYRRLA